MPSFTPAEAREAREADPWCYQCRPAPHHGGAKAAVARQTAGLSVPRLTESGQRVNKRANVRYLQLIPLLVGAFFVWHVSG